MAESFISPYLPKKFITRHELLLFFNDILVDMLEKADKYNLTSSTINIKNNKEIPSDVDNIIDWLIENGYKDEAFKSTKAHVFFSLLRDFMFYMHESFSCSERGKVTVAFSNSRKPIKDNLFYMCWLLVDSEELLTKLLDEDPKTFDVSRMDYEDKERIIDEATRKINFPLSGEMLTEVIYNRKSARGLSSIWDKTLHIITGNRNYPTSVGNLNFIFADDEVWDEHWNAYYEKIPFIMTFASKVSITLFEEIAGVSNDIKTFNQLIRSIKYDMTFSDDFNPDNYKNLFNELLFTCEECEGEFKLDEKLEMEFISDYLFSCPNCESLERVGQYYFGSSD